MNELVKIEKLEQEISPVVLKANWIKVTSPAQYEEAADFLKEIKTAQKKVDLEAFDPLRESKRGIEKLWSKFKINLSDPLNYAEITIKNKMLVFQRAEDEKRLAEQRRLQAESGERARKERERLQKRAEKLKTPELKEQALQEAEEVEVPVVTVQSEVPEVKGISYRKDWKAEVTDKPEFVKAALKNTTLMSFIHIDMVQMNKLATMTKGQISYPGIRFYQKETLASGRK